MEAHSLRGPQFSNRFFTSGFVIVGQKHTSALMEKSTGASQAYARGRARNYSHFVGKIH